MFSKIALVVAGSLTGLMVPTAFGVLYLSQTRSVSAYVNWGGGNVIETAADFAPWDHSVTAGPGDFGGSSTARQISSLSPLQVGISSTLSPYRPTAAGAGVATAKSSLAVTFNVHHTTGYHLTGSMYPGPSYPPPYVGRPRLVTLTGPATNVFLSGSWSGSGSVPPTLTGSGAFDLTGLFDPGTYTFTIVGESSDNAGPAGSGAELLSSFSGNLEILPPRGDFDSSGDLEAADVDLLFTAVPGPVPPANWVFDLNADSNVNIVPNTAASDVDYWVRDLAGSAYGDTNLDQRVDFSDLLVLAQHYQSSEAGWALGNFDGVAGVEFSDLLLLAQSYGFGTDELSAADFVADWNAARSIVPEPTAIGLVLVLTPRGRRRS